MLAVALELKKRVMVHLHEGVISPHLAVAGSNLCLGRCVFEVKHNSSGGKKAVEELLMCDSFTSEVRQRGTK